MGSAKVDSYFRKSLYLMNAAASSDLQREGPEEFRMSVISQTANFSHTSFGEINIKSSSNTHVGNRIKKLVIGNYNVVERPYKKRIIVLKFFLTSILVIVFLINLWFLLFYIINKLSRQEPENRGSKEFKELILSSVVIDCENDEHCKHTIDFTEWGKKYHFFISNKGSLFRGTGWLDDPSNFNNYVNNSLQIALIGNYNEIETTAELWLTLNKLLSTGVTDKNLLEDYLISPICCYKHTSSPGVNVLKQLQLDPHFMKPCRSSLYVCPWRVLDDKSYSLAAFCNSTKHKFIKKFSNHSTFKQTETSSVTSTLKLNITPDLTTASEFDIATTEMTLASEFDTEMIFTSKFIIPASKINITSTKTSTELAVITTKV